MARVTRTRFIRAGQYRLVDGSLWHPFVELEQDESETGAYWTRVRSILVGKTATVAKELCFAAGQLDVVSASISALAAKELDIPASEAAYCVAGYEHDPAYVTDQFPWLEALTE